MHHRSASKSTLNYSFPLITFILVLSLLSVVGACAPQQSIKEPSQKLEKQVLQPDPALLTGVLDNGLRYAILPNSTPLGTGALRVQFQAGSLDELPGTEGLAHYLEHMAFNGSKNVPEGEMIHILERLGLSFGADTNASTGLERTIYKLNLPTITPEVLDTAFMLMQETAYNLNLDQDAIDRELGIILSEKRTRDSANYRAWETRMRFLSGQSDLMDRLPIGKETSLKSITSDDFKEFYAAHYRPENTIVAFVGDYDPDKILDYINTTFGAWQPKTEAVKKSLPSPAVVPKGEIKFYAEDGLSTNVSLIALRPYKERKDTVEYRSQRLLERLATGMMSYRMQSLAEQADRPFVSASMGQMSNFKLTEGMAFSAYTQPENWQKALVGLDVELRKVLKFGFSEVELKAQLSRLHSAFIALAEGADTRPTTSRRGGLIDQIMFAYDSDKVFTHPQQNLEMFLAASELIDLQIVNQAMRNLWGDIDDLNVYLSTDTSIENPEVLIKTVLNKSRQTEIPAPSQDHDIAEEFAYIEFGEPGSVINYQYHEQTDSHLYKFENNVKLNFKQTDYEDDRVVIRVDFGDGNFSTPRKNEGLRRMAYGLMSGGGVEKHTRSEISRLMAGKLVSSGSFNFQAGGDSFNMTTVTVPINFRDQLNVFAASLSAPVFREEVRSNFIDKLKAWYPRHDNSISGVVSKHVQRIIRSGDERFGFEEEQEFYNSTIEEIERWLRPQFENGQVEITIVGDIDKETVVSEIAATFGALPKRASKKGEYPEMRMIKFPEGSSDVFKLYHRGDDNQAQLRIYWPASSGFDAKYSRQLQALRSILRNRLVTEIREGEATTYSPQAASYASQTFPGYGYIAAILTLKPEDIPEMAAKVHAIVNDIAENPLEEDEFNRAITPMIERLVSTDKRNPYWVSVLSDAQSKGNGLRRHESRESDINEMTVEDVEALAKNIFIIDSSIEIHVLPKN